MATPRGRAVAGLLDGIHQQAENLLGFVDLGREATFVTEARGEALARKQLRRAA